MQHHGFLLPSRSWKGRAWALFLCTCLLLTACGGEKGSISQSSSGVESATTSSSSDMPPSSQPKTSSQEEPPSAPTGGEDDKHLLLVNPWNPLPQDYQVELVAVNSSFSVDALCYDDLVQMLADCRAAGLSPLICSAYRSIDRQQKLFDNMVASCMAQGLSSQEAKEETARIIAVPGTSEHHLGLAVDLVATSHQLLDSSQENTAEQQWLMSNSWKYGFVLRYPSDKSEITGIIYEPWHYRYVGKQDAKAMFDTGLCLEEYRNQ